MLAEADERSNGIHPGADRAEAIEALGGRTIALDCRWLGIGGAGRVTELVLASFREDPPPGRWLLWGNPVRVAPFAFPGATIVPWHGQPTRWFGQADLLRVPLADVVVYFHQIRPLRPGLSVTFVLDTIPLRTEHRPGIRALKTLFFRLSCRLSARVVTISPWSRDSLVRDLGVSRSTIVITSLGVDPARIARIRAIRDRGGRANQVLFIGRFAAHKNLDRLCRAFQTTSFRQAGGRLVLVGGTVEDVTEVSARLARDGLRDIEVRGVCPEAELDQLLGTCRAVVQPSLEEGYGLPAVEAAASGIQVATSLTGYAKEIPLSLATFMDPLSEESIATAIDAAVGRPTEGDPWVPPSTVGCDVLRICLGVLSRRE